MYEQFSTSTPSALFPQPTSTGLYSSCLLWIRQWEQMMPSSKTSAKQFLYGNKFYIFLCFFRNLSNMAILCAQNNVILRLTKIYWIPKYLCVCVWEREREREREKERERWWFRGVFVWLEMCQALKMSCICQREICSPLYWPASPLIADLLSVTEFRGFDSMELIFVYITEWTVLIVCIISD